MSAYLSQSCRSMECQCYFDTFVIYSVELLLQLLQIQIYFFLKIWRNFFTKIGKRFFNETLLFFYWIKFLCSTLKFKYKIKKRCLKNRLLFLFVIQRHLQQYRIKIVNGVRFLIASVYAYSMLVNRTAVFRICDILDRQTLLCKQKQAQRADTVWQGSTRVRK